MKKFTMRHLRYLKAKFESKFTPELRAKIISELKFYMRVTIFTITVFLLLVALLILLIFILRNL